MGLSKSILQEPDRKRLDSIVSQMHQNNESDEAIQIVVEDFKSKYGKKKDGGNVSASGGPSTSQNEDVSPFTDFDKYGIKKTVLPPDQERQYQSWKSKLPKNLQSEAAYDLRRMWQENKNTKPDSNLHFPDTYKYPNHPSFSDQSVYFNDKTKKFAGKWVDQGDTFVYQPYDENTKQRFVEDKKTGEVIHRGPANKPFPTGSEFVSGVTGIKKKPAAESFQESAFRISDELSKSDNIITSEIGKQSFQKHQQQLKALRNDGYILKVGDDGKFTKVTEPDSPYALPSKQEIEKIKQQKIQDPVESRKLLSEIIKTTKDEAKKKQLQEDAFVMDGLRYLEDENPEQEQKFFEAKEKIKTGEYEYDPVSTRLIKPQGILESIATGWRERQKTMEDYDLLTTGKKKNHSFDDFKLLLGPLAAAWDSMIDVPDEAKDANVWKELEAERNKPNDPFDAVPVPESGFAGLAQAIAGTPPRGIVAGLATGVVAPPAAPYVAGVVGGEDAFKMGYASEYKRVFNELRDQGVPVEEAGPKAKEAARAAGAIDAVVGGLSTAAGFKLGSTPLKINFSQPIKEIGESLARGAGLTVAEGGLAGLGMSEGQRLKNLQAQDLGVSSRDEYEGTAEVWQSGFLTTVAIAGATKAAHIGGSLLLRGFKKKIDRAAFIRDAAKIPEEITTPFLSQLEETGAITKEDAAETKANISKARVLNDAMGEVVEYKGNIGRLINDDEGNYVVDLPEKQVIISVADKTNAVEGLSDLGVKVLDENEKAINSRDSEQFGEVVSNNGNRFFVYLADPRKKGTFDQVYLVGKGGKQKQVGGMEDNVKLRLINKFLKEKGLPERTSLVNERGEVAATKKTELTPAETIELAEVEGKLPDTITAEAKNNPEQFLKEVADQVYGRNADGSKSLRPDAEQAAREQFGDEVVDAAKKMYPKEEAAKLTVEAEQSVKPTAPIEEAAPPSPKQEPEMVGITHAQMNEVAKEFGWDDYEKAPETFEQWDAQARERLANDPDAIPKMLMRMREFQTDPVDQRMMLMHVANLKAKINKNPADVESVRQLQQARNISNMEGRMLGKALVARKGETPVQEIPDLPNMLVDKIESAGVEKLTPEQTAEVTKQYEEIKKTNDAAQLKLQEYEETIVQLRAENKVKQQAKSAKKNAQKDYAAEREKIVASIREKLRKSRGEASAVAIPYVKELIAIAPDVANYVTSLIEQGIDQLPDLITRVRDLIKEDIPDATDKDVRDLIAGRYNEKPTDEQRLQAAKDRATKGRLKTEIDTIDKEFAPEKRTSLEEDAELRKKYPDLWKQTMDALRAKAEARKRWELEKLKDERANEGAVKKAGRVVSKVVGTSRALLSGIDLSGNWIQNGYAMLANPRIGAKAFLKQFPEAVNPKAFERNLESIHNLPEWDLIEQSGLDVLEPGALDAAKMEEIFNNNVLAKYQPWKYTGGIFERAYTSLGNNLRVMLFLERARQLGKGDPFAADPQALKDAARGINELTARGKLPGQSGGVLSMLFWSPKMMASSFNLLGISDIVVPIATGGERKGFYAGLSPTERKYVAGQIVRGIGTGIGIMGAFALFGGNRVDLNPQSTGFGNVEIDGKEYNVFGRFTTYVKTIAQVLTGKKVTKSGSQELNSEKFGAKTKLDVAFNFARGKANPLLGTGMNLLAGKDLGGNKFTLENVPHDLLTPLLIRDLKQAAETGGVKGLLTHLPAILGVNIQNEKAFIRQKYEQDKPINYKAGGREATFEEYQQFVDKRDAEIERRTNILKQKGLPQPGAPNKPYFRLTQDEIDKELQAIKTAATKQAKEAQFGEEKKSNKQRRDEEKANQKKQKMYKQ